MASDYIRGLAENLKNNGIKYVFGISGGGVSLELINELISLGCLYYPCSHEAAAVMMAGSCCTDGVMRACAIGIKGPGFANFIPGIVHNMYESRPALTISEAYPVGAPLSQQHKRLDHAGLSNNICKVWAAYDGSNTCIEALKYTAETERPGPVHLDVAASAAIADGEKISIPEKKKKEIKDFSVIEKLLHSIKHPVVIIGEASSRLLPDFDFASLGIPVLTTAAAKGVMPETHPLAGGIVTGEINELSPESQIIAQSDCVIGVLLRNYGMIKAAPFGKLSLLIDNTDAYSDGFAPDGKICADNVPDVLEYLRTALADKAWGTDIIRGYRKALQDELYRDQNNAAAYFNEFQNILPDTTTLVLDTGLFCTVGETVWKASEKADFCGSSIGRFMGTAIPTAIGASVSHPGRTVLCACGDGGLRPYLPEISLAVDKKLPIIFAMFSDGRYGTFAAKAASLAVDPDIYTMKEIEWEKICGKFGCRSYVIDSVQEIKQIIADWSDLPGPVFVRIRLDQAGYDKMAKRLR